MKDDHYPTFKELIELSKVDTDIKAYRLLDWAQPMVTLPRAFCPHIVAVTIVQGHKLVQVNEDGVFERTIDHGGRRGSEVCITYVDEDDTMHYEIRAFHKGAVECQMASFSVPLFDNTEEGEPSTPLHLTVGELWRN